jgi:hypothetical protein
MPQLIVRQRAAHAVAELFAVVLMPLRNAAFLRGQKRHCDFVIIESGARIVG